MTTVLVGMTWAGERGKLLRHFRSQAGDEGLIQGLFDAAVQTCHEEIGRRDFTDPVVATVEWIAGMGLTDADPDEVLAAAAIPAPVRLGVYEWVRVAYFMRSRLPGVVNESNGSASEGRDLWSARNQGHVPLSVARGYWRRYLLDATLAGGSASL